MSCALTNYTVTRHTSLSTTKISRIFVDSGYGKRIAAIAIAMSKEYQTVFEYLIFDNFELIGGCINFSYICLYKQLKCKHEKRTVLEEKLNLSVLGMPKENLIYLNSDEENPRFYNHCAGHVHTSIYCYSCNKSYCQLYLSEGKTNNNSSN